MTTRDLLNEMARYLGDDAPALSLPPAAFTSPELWELERGRVFGRSWVLVAHADDLREPGSSVTLSIAGEPVAVFREPGADLRAVRARHGAPAPVVEQWHGFVHVNLDPSAEAVSGALSRVEQDLAAYRLPEMVQVGTWVEQWRCNWKLAVQNAHENYHVMGFHPDTVALISSAGSDMEVRWDDHRVTRLRSPFREPMAASVLTLSPEQEATMYNACLFPCSSVATFGEQIIWISLIPVSIDRTEVRGGALMPPGLLDGADLAEIRRESEEGAAVVNRQDREGLEAVQRVVASRFAERGHLSPKEPGVLTFYRSLASWLLSPAAA